MISFKCIHLFCPTSYPATSDAMSIPGPALLAYNVYLLVPILINIIFPLLLKCKMHSVNKVLKLQYTKSEVNTKSYSV